MTTDPPDHNGGPSSDNRHKEGHDVEDIEGIEAQVAAGELTRKAADHLLGVIHDPTYQIMTDAESERFSSLMIDLSTGLLLRFVKACTVEDLIDLFETAHKEWPPERLLELIAALTKLSTIQSVKWQPTTDPVQRDPGGPLA